MAGTAAIPRCHPLADALTRHPPPHASASPPPPSSASSRPLRLFHPSCVLLTGCVLPRPMRGIGIGHPCAAARARGPARVSCGCASRWMPARRTQRSDGAAVSKLQQSATRTPARTQITHPDDAPAPWRVLCAVAVAARAMSPALLRLLRVLSAFNCSTRRAARGGRIMCSAYECVIVAAVRCARQRTIFRQFSASFAASFAGRTTIRKTCRRFCWSSPRRFCFLSRMFLTY